MVWMSERPLWRSMVKLAISTFGGRRWRHAQDWLPGLRLTLPIEPGATGSIVYRGSAVAQLIHPAALKGVSSSVHIVGSGPSIKDNDLGLTGSQSCILLNGAIGLVDAGVSAPLAIAVEDERFIWRHFNLLRTIKKTTCLLSTSAIRAICEIDPSWLHGQQVILIDDIRKPYRHQRRSDQEIASFDFVEMSGDGTAGFSMEPSRGVFQGGSVLISALQFAVYWGPEEIGMFGIDISNASQPRFYEREGITAKSGLVEGKKRILAHVALAKKISNQRVIRLSNFSPVSALRECGLDYDDRFARSQSLGFSRATV
jgi:hypothetical protein